MEWSSLIGPILGVIGIPLGLLLGEYLRRRQRAEQFAAVIFAKRLKAYETLLVLLNDGNTIAEDVLNNPDLSTEIRHDMISTAIHQIAAHNDQNVLYINEELGAHCTALFMGVEDIHNLPQTAKEKRLADHYAQWRKTRRMILEDSGVSEVNKLFQTINRPKISSPVIDRIRELRRERSEST